MRFVLIIAFCLGLVACTEKIPLELERSADSKAQRALLERREEFHDFQQIQTEKQRVLRKEISPVK